MILWCSVKLENVRASRDHLIVNVREDGLQAITIYALPPAGKSVESLSEGQKIKFPEPTYSLEDESYQFNSHIFRYGYSSLRTPQSVYDYDLNSGKAVLKKLKPVYSIDLPPFTLALLLLSMNLSVLLLGYKHQISKYSHGLWVDFVKLKTWHQVTLNFNS